MAYIINKTNGEILTTLIDGQVDTTTDLTLIGKNYTGFGEQLNENFVRLLENFSGSSEPPRPIMGQLWYDTVDGRMKVYGTTGWKAAGGPIVQSVEPLSFTTGDIWIDDNENQMYFFDGSDLILAGPIWKRSQRKTGFVAVTLFDQNNNAKPVLYLYVADSLIGIFSSSQFVPVPVVEGFTTIYKGYTASSLVASTFNTTVTNALQLNGINSNLFMRTDQSTSNDKKITIGSNDGLTIGANQIGDFKISGTTIVIENVVDNSDISLRVSNNTTTSDAVYVDASTSRVGIFTSAPQQTLDINGSVIIRGNLVVQQDTVTLDVSQLRVEDKNIELGSTSDSTPPDDLAIDGGGIILRAHVNKTILYKLSRQITNGTPAPYVNHPVFDISENINLASGKFFAIGGVKVLDGSTLSAAITSAPGITSIGPQIELTVDDLYINNNRIECTVLNSDIELAPTGTGNITILNGGRIKNVGYPTDPTDATPKYYVDAYAQYQPLSLSLIDNGLTGAINTNVILVLNDIADPVQFVPGKLAYVHLQSIDFVGSAVNRYLKKFIIKNTGGANFWDFESDLTSSV